MPWADIDAGVASNTARTNAPILFMDLFLPQVEDLEPLLQGSFSVPGPFCPLVMAAEHLHGEKMLAGA
jgi:hypothetical protein